MSDEYDNQDSEEQAETGNIVLEGTISEDDYDRAYVDRAADSDGRIGSPDDETFERLKDRWDDLDTEQRHRVYDSLNKRQQKQIQREYGTLQGASDLREYSPDNDGLDDDRFQDSYQDWEDLDTEERQERWRQMNGEQKKHILSEYSSSSLFGDEEGPDESYEDWMVSPEEWNEKDPDEREQLWFGGKLSLKERRTMASSDDYRIQDLDMDPSQYEDESWYSMTQPEQLAVIESDEYSVEDFGKDGYRPRGSDGSFAGMITGATTGTASIHFTWPMITSGNPETVLMGASIQTASSIGGFALGSLAAGDTSFPEKRHTFSDDELQDAYRSQQQTDQEDDPSDQSWNFVGRLIDSVNQDEEKEKVEEESQNSS